MQKWLILAMVFWLFGCSGTSTRVRNHPPSSALSKSEIYVALHQRPLDSAFEVIQFLRPHYLMPRTLNTVNHGTIRVTPKVYLNNALFGDVNELHNIGARQIASVEYLKSYEATTRLGIGHEGGAIMIYTQ